MADSTKKRRVIKKPETVRQQAAKAATATPKPRRVRRTVRRAQTPLRVILSGIKRLVSPFSFVLIPFKTRPARFVGRVLSKVLALNYFKQSWLELRQVTWPTRRETIKLTFAVSAFAIVFALLIAVVDYGLNKVFEQLLT